LLYEFISDLVDIDISKRALFGLGLEV
jgi:hypothetical protein